MAASCTRSRGSSRSWLGSLSSNAEDESGDLTQRVGPTHAPLTSQADRHARAAPEAAQGSATAHRAARTVEARRSRRDDTRRKIVVGAIVLAKVEQGVLEEIRA